MFWTRSSFTQCLYVGTVSGGAGPTPADLHSIEDPHRQRSEYHGDQLHQPMEFSLAVSAHQPSIYQPLAGNYLSLSSPLFRNLIFLLFISLIFIYRKTKAMNNRFGV